MSETTMIDQIKISYLEIFMDKLNSTKRINQARSIRAYHRLQQKYNYQRQTLSMMNSLIKTINKIDRLLIKEVGRLCLENCISTRRQKY
ncbi:hypothetical protein FGO68_gene9213 [Halteria grandinella]|uniref:Uncharacterized protein n=1 Tax=Halteria grandinella TaxID=5974 RepID=A0A8J8NUD1_HALGN|nr:hypothetical protein FGO68_gene9213 [Halteria grandinella]